MAELIVGVISDTEGTLHPEVLADLQAADLIVHAGDIGSAEILATLTEVAPVTAVRGNLDVVITGHTHRPALEWIDGVLYVNPGSAGRGTPPSWVLLRIDETGVRGEIRYRAEP